MAESHRTRRPRNFIDLVGQRFGRLLVKREHSNEKSIVRWECQCDCGNIHIVATANLRHSHTKSCGCLRHENKSNLKHGLSYTVERKAWARMMGRCYNPNCDSYSYYGGRGIIVCDRWRNSMEAFVADMGPRPLGTSLDRVETNGNYEPGNCRWADRNTQMRNRRNSVMLTFNGKTQTMVEWANELGLGYKMLQHRHARGWSAEQILAPRRVRWSRQPLTQTT